MSGKMLSGMNQKRRKGLILCSHKGKGDIAGRGAVGGGDEGIRTPGLSRAKAALSQLSYVPTVTC